MVVWRRGGRFPSKDKGFKKPKLPIQTTNQGSPKYDDSFIHKGAWRKQTRSVERKWMFGRNCIDVCDNLPTIVIFREGRQINQSKDLVAPTNQSSFQAKSTWSHQTTTQVAPQKGQPRWVKRGAHLPEEAQQICQRVATGGLPICICLSVASSCSTVAAVKSVLRIHQRRYVPFDHPTQRELLIWPERC